MELPVSEATLRLVLFATLFTLFALLEALQPRRARSPMLRRWVTNLSFSLLGSLTLRLLFILLSTSAVGLGLIVQENGWGLVQQISLPFWARFMIGFLALDLAIWAQHLAMHKVPPLWRLHRVHHADAALDASSGLRFHPVEYAASMAWKLALILALGLGPWTVLIFEIALNATSMFNHANWRLPLTVDRALRLVLVTPDMHRVHHSVLPAEHNSNFGFNFSLWDRLFGTYQAQPAAGHENMRIGLTTIAAPQSRNLLSMLINPFGRG